MRFGSVSQIRRFDSSSNRQRGYVTNNHYYEPLIDIKNLCLELRLGVNFSGINFSCDNPPAARSRGLAGRHCQTDANNKSRSGGPFHTQRACTLVTHTLSTAMNTLLQKAKSRFNFLTFVAAIWIFKGLDLVTTGLNHAYIWLKHGCPRAELAALNDLTFPQWLRVGLFFVGLCVVCLQLRSRSGQEAVQTSADSPQ